QPSSKGKTIGNLHISTNEPHPGDIIKINYKAPDSVLENNSLKGIYYILLNNKVYAQDLHLSKTNGAWVSKIKIPDSASAIAFNFKINNHEYLPNDGKGYVQPLFNNSEKIIPGSISSISYFYRINLYRIRGNIKKDSIL